MTTRDEQGKPGRTEEENPPRNTIIQWFLRPFSPKSLATSPTSCAECESAEEVGAPRWHVLFEGSVAGSIDNHPNQDAYDAFNAANGTFAVADGVTERCIFQDIWAQILCEEFALQNLVLTDQIAFDEWRNRSRERWYREVLRQYGEPGTWSWFDQDAFLTWGARAAFLGLALSVTAGNHVAMRAYAIGDCDVVHLRDGTVVTAFPIAQADQFNSFPKQMATMDAGVRSVDNVASVDWTLLPGDTIVIGSDEISKFLLAHTSSFLSFINTVPAKAADRLADQVAVWRGEGKMETDDVTVIVIQID